MEAALGANAVRCAEMAACASPRKGKTPYEQEFAKRVEQATYQVKKLTTTAHNAMSKQLYSQSGLQDLVGAFGELLEKVAAQDKRKLKPKGAGYETRTINTFPTPAIIVVNTWAMLSSLIDDVYTLDHHRTSPQLAVDLEGAKFQRNGDISIVQISSHELDSVYLVDIYTLGNAVFDVKGAKHSTCSLRTILESTTISKLMFDCRTDNDVLLHTAGVRLAGVIDLQLLFLATRTKSGERKKLPSLPKVIGYAGGLLNTDKHKWNFDKHWGRIAMTTGPDEALELIEKFDGEWNNSECGKLSGQEDYKWVNQRPISKLIQKYCAADVVMLPAAYEYCINHRFWNEEWADRVEREMKWRLGMADAEVFEHNYTVLQAAPPGWDKVKQVDKTETAGKVAVKASTATLVG